MNVARDAAKASGVAVAAGFDVLLFVVFVVLVQSAADKANSSNDESTSERIISQSPRRIDLGKAAAV